MVKFRENKGITLVTLAATVAVLFILLTVSLTVGTNVIEKIKLDNYYTNIHAVKTKAKVFAEEVNAQVWNLDENQKKEKLEFHILELPKFNEDIITNHINKKEAWMIYLKGDRVDLTNKVIKKYNAIGKLDSLLKEYWENEKME